MAKNYAVPAAIWKRAVAFVIDLFVINLFILTPFKPILSSKVPVGGTYSEMMEFFASNPEQMSTIVTAMMVVTALTLIYFTLMELKLQQTIGKMIMGIFIVSETKELKFFPLLLSNITFIPFFPFMLLWLIDPVYMFTSPKAQRLMERVTGIQQVEYYKYGR